ncbi:MAG: hypothetical protein PVI57_20060 [Gemmatimonadota bacterium]|jgi:hypothetical protein
MARQMLTLHWKAAKWLLLPIVLAAFGLPVLAVRGLGGSASEYGYRALYLVQAGRTLLPLFPTLAAAVGGLLALTAWNWDHRGEHVYSLSLPVARWEWAVLKFGAGLVLLGVPAVAFLVGSLVATASVDLPAGLTAYPLAVSARFALAALVSYAVLFAMAAGTIRTTVIVLSAFLGGLFLGQLAVDFVASAYQVPWLQDTSVTEAVFQTLNTWPGPFQVFFGNWMLIDV